MNRPVSIAESRRFAATTIARLPGPTILSAGSHFRAVGDGHNNLCAANLVDGVDTGKTGRNQRRGVGYRVSAG